MPKPAHPDKNSPREAICSAIRARRVIHFYYGSERRARFCQAEPYCYGLLPDGEETLLCYQVSGHGELDAPFGWKLYRPSLMSDITVTEVNFAGNRSGEGFHKRFVFTTLYGRVIPGPLSPEAPPAPVPVVPEVPVAPPAPSLGHHELMKRFRLGHWLFGSKKA